MTTINDVKRDTLRMLGALPIMASGWAAAQSAKGTR